MCQVTKSWRGRSALSSPGIPRLPASLGACTPLPYCSWEGASAWEGRSVSQMPKRMGCIFTWGEVWAKIWPLLLRD